MIEFRFKLTYSKFWIFGKDNLKRLGNIRYGSNKRIEIYLPAFSDKYGKQLESEDEIIVAISKTITHEYIHDILDDLGINKNHHYITNKMGLNGV
jgi:hypothetical protein